MTMHKPPALLSLHRWIALAFAPLLLIQAATGSVLLFRDELARLAHPVIGAPAGPGLPLSALAEAAQSTHPEMRLTRLFFPSDRASAAFAQLEGPGGTVRHVAIDPADGAVMASGTVWRFPLEAALQIHFRLMAGTVGLVVVSLNGLALALIAASGLWHWWPGARRVGRELKAPARAPARLKLRMWHRSLGAVLALVLMTSATTGVLLAVPNLPLGGAATMPVAAPAAIDADRLDRAFAAAQASYPKARPRDVRLAPDGSLSVNFFAPRGGRWAVDVVTVSAAPDYTVSKLPLERNDALWLTALPIHSGDTLGPAGRWPMLAAALALVALVVSGPLLWWRRTRKGPAR
jgi:uncharacterized iron-regulated membrane protein